MSVSKATIDKYLRNYSILLLLPIAIGFICGLEAIFIRTIIPLTFGRVMDLAGINKSLTIPIIFVFLLAGAYITWLLSRRLREISGVGLNVTIESYHSRAGMMPSTFAPLKFLATFFTLGLGGSGGLVGPAAAIGQGTASYFSKWLKLPQDRSRILALCGIAGCISGLLHTPFGAAVFALEVCYMGAIVYEDFVPVLLSSISAYIMTARIARVLPFGDLLQQPHLFRTIVHDTAFPWSLDYLAYCIIAALFTTLLVIVFIKAFLFIQESSGRIFKGRYRPVVGAILVALVAFLFFRKRLGDVLGELSELVERCATSEELIDAPIALLAGRSATTFFTVGFGGSGGLFAPTVLVGSLSGITVARLLGINNVGILVTTGISAALVGVMNVPMAAVIIAVEIFGVSFIIPAAIGSMIAFLLAKNWVIYPNIQRYREPE